MIKLHEVKLRFNKITVRFEMSRVHHQELFVGFFNFILENSVISYSCTSQCVIIGRVITVRNGDDSGDGKLKHWR